MSFLKKKIGLLLIIILIFIIANLFFWGTFKKTCDNENCFSDHLSTCSPIEYISLVNGNTYEYIVYRSLGENCKLTVQLEKTSEGTDFDSKEKLEGKSMSCLIPKEELYNLDLNELNNLLKFCTGPLKEGIYEIIIKNMYNIILSNLGEVLSEVQTTLVKKL